MDNNAPIGVFDSGVGGLSLLRELDFLMPYESFMYIGDTERMPYGTKSEEEITAYSDELISFLEKRGCKMIVIACNTVSGLRPEIENGPQLHVPVVGVINYGCISAALYVTYNFRIGVWATQRTIDSKMYRRFLDSFDPTIQLHTMPCTDILPYIEKGRVGAPAVRKIAEKYLNPMLNDEIDTLILGCTHLPFIKTIVQDIISPAVTIIDPARRTAALCMKILNDRDLLKQNHSSPGVKQFFVTGDPDSFLKTARILIGPMVTQVDKVSTNI